MAPHSPAVIRKPYATAVLLKKLRWCLYRGNNLFLWHLLTPLFLSRKVMHWFPYLQHYQDLQTLTNSVSSTIYGLTGMTIFFVYLVFYLYTYLYGNQRPNHRESIGILALVNHT